MWLFSFFSFVKELRNSHGKRLGWMSFSRRSSSQLLAANFPRGFKPAPTWLLPPIHWQRKALGVFREGAAERAGCCHFQNNSFGPHLGLELPSSSPGKEVAKSKVTDKISGPRRLSQVTYCGLGRETVTPKYWWMEKTKTQVPRSQPPQTF